jgi:DNA-binding transcriptional regulator YiaG
MMITQHGGMVGTTRVVDQFDATDLGAPFKVILHNAVRITQDQETGELLSYAIPNLEGLIRAVVITRILHARKLSGADIRFIRKAIGVKQKDMALRLGMSCEHLSRCETGTLVMSPTSEKLLRIFALKTAIKLHNLKTCEAKTKLEDALDKLFDCIKPVSVHDVENVLELHFRRSKSSSDENGNDDLDGGDGEWDGDQSAEAA